MTNHKMTEKDFHSQSLKFIKTGDRIDIIESYPTRESVTWTHYETMKRIALLEELLWKAYAGLLKYEGNPGVDIATEIREALEVEL